MSSSKSRPSESKKNEELEGNVWQTTWVAVLSASMVTCWPDRNFWITRLQFNYFDYCDSCHLLCMEQFSNWYTRF